MYLAKRREISELQEMFHLSVQIWNSFEKIKLNFLGFYELNGSYNQLSLV